MWCVELLLKDGTKHRRVFEDVESAKRFMRKIIGYVYEGSEVVDVDYWEM